MNMLCGPCLGTNMCLVIIPRFCLLVDIFGLILWWSLCAGFDGCSELG